MQFRVGRELEEGEESSSGLYALISRQKGLVLRICMVKELAWELVDPEWRYIAECWLL